MPPIRSLLLFGIIFRTVLNSLDLIFNNIRLSARANRRPADGIGEVRQVCQ